MSKQPENETLTPEQSCQALLRELEASQQAIAEINKASQQAIAGLLEELEEFQRLTETLEQFSRNFAKEQSLRQRLDSSTFHQFDPSVSPFFQREK